MILSFCPVRGDYLASASEVLKRLLHAVQFKSAGHAKDRVSDDEAQVFIVIFQGKWHL